MKSLAYSLIWTMLFLLFSFCVINNFSEFANTYTKKAELIESYIENEKWNLAKVALDEYDISFNKNKLNWYKLLNHEYFENISFNISLLHKSIISKNQDLSFEQIEKIKNDLRNILESEHFDLNHIL